jgi:hypothetical protein
MTVDAFERIIEVNGMELAQTGTDGLPELSQDETFDSTFENVTLVIGSDQQFGPGTVHTSIRCRYPIMYFWVMQHDASRRITHPFGNK